jgi:two-component system sensor histidine kinase MtrB
VASVCDGLAPLARDAAVDLVLRLPDHPVTMVMDPRRVARVLRNLVSNAIEHGESRPVEVRVAATATSAAVTVRDHGIGLHPDQLALVFSRFWRGDPARARTTGGSGLGLAISLEDARIHGGELQAWGQPGVGSCFRLTLPRVPGAPAGEAPLPLVPDDAETQVFPVLDTRAADQVLPS